MVFNPSIPQPTDFLSISQGDLLGNMGQLQTWSNVDHYPVADNTINLGKHAKSTYPFQASGPATLSGEVAVYSKQVSGITELFCRKESSGTEIQVTSGNTLNVFLVYVQFNGATGAIVGTASNVTSVTHSSTGQYIVNFSINLPTSTYGVFTGVSFSTQILAVYSTQTTTSVNISTSFPGGAATDAGLVTVGIVGH